jgi:CheY-like chemotaxis protein
LSKILIVDDDTDLLEGQKAFLASRGYDVQTAVSMEDGLQKAEAFQPELIVADLMMEHFDTGFAFCKKVRERPGLASVPIIMQTAAAREVGFSLDASSAKAREWMKVNEVLNKPVPLEHLLGKIEQYLNR